MIGIAIRKGNPEDGKESTRKAVAEAVDHIAYIRALELKSEAFTAEEFDEMLNEESARAYERYENMDMTDLLFQGMLHMFEHKVREAKENE